MSAFEEIATRLDALCGSDGRFLAGGVARIGPDGAETAHVTGRIAPGGVQWRDPSLRMRMASVSKMATARAVVAVAADRGVAMDTPVSTLLPDMDLPKVTLAHLLAHISGLTDRAGYVVEPPASVAAFLAEHPDAVSGTAPGAFFRYANLNYILLGMALERMAGARFDVVLRRFVLEPAGIAGGFNWSGVAVRRALPMWQRHGGSLTCEADGPDTDWTAPVVWRGGHGLSAVRYRMGRDTTLFSPHAGLRMSLPEAARLALFVARDDAVGRTQRERRWQFDGTNGEDCGGLFTAFGAGVTIYRDHPRIPGPLIGHAGHALGFTGGAWANEATGEAWAYALNGSADLTEGQDEEAFYDADEAEIMALL